MPNPPQHVNGSPANSAARFVSACILVLVATVLIPLVVKLVVKLTAESIGAYQTWAVVTAIVDLFAVTGIVLGLGYTVTGKISGIALSTWNDYSLSKLQMALWTIVVLSGLFTAAKLNLLGYFGNVPIENVLAINIPPNFWRQWASPRSAPRRHRPFWR